MKYLLAIMFSVCACDDIVKDADYFTECRDEIKRATTCEESFTQLQQACQKTIPRVSVRPREGEDSLGQCLWAMKGVYGGKFPVGEHVKYEETRPAFFFRCLKEYPGVMEEFCCYKRDECLEELEVTELQSERRLEACREACGNRDYCSCF